MPVTTWSPYARIGRPLEAHEVDSIEAYRARQAATIATLQAARPSMRLRSPFDAEDKPIPFVSAGRWVCLCPHCGNAPSFDPTWRAALCFECGARFLDLDPPAGWEQAEAILMRRPAMNSRHWFPWAEPLAALEAENLAHGIAPLGSEA